MNRGRPLVRMLAQRMVVLAGAAAVLLLAFVVISDLRDPEELFEKTQLAQAKRIVQALEAGEQPADWPLYRDFPQSYGFRVFQKSRPPGERLVSQANADLLPPFPGEQPGQKDPILSLREGFEAVVPEVEGHAANRWLLTTRQEGRNVHGFWVQTIMIDDPAWCRWRALADEVMTHVLLPVGALMLAMTLDILFLVRRALRPLNRVAMEMQTLSLAAAQGAALAPLPESGLPCELRQVVKAANTMLVKLDDALARERTFAADAAHELRTPVAVLRLQIAELPKSPIVDRLDEELAALAHLIGQLLRFAQAEDVMARECRPINIAEVARHVCEDMAPLALARGQELMFVEPGQSPMLPGNATLIGVALRNLVENALRASPSDGVVKVIVIPEGLIVEDCGPGIADNNKQHIFDRLWQADRRREGAGIGLALVRRIAQLHRGSVTVGDRSGGGARFVLQLKATSQQLVQADTRRVA